jgi:ribonuclease P protein component
LKGYKIRVKIRKKTRGSQAMRFSRNDRLNTQAEFRFVFSGHIASSDRFFRVLARPNGKDHCRLGMAVSKKACRKAVGRNRLKRLIRENFRQNRKQLAREQDISSGFDYVVLPTVQAASICNKILTGSLQDHWQKAQDIKHCVNN